VAREVGTRAETADSATDGVPPTEVAEGRGGLSITEQAAVLGPIYQGLMNRYSSNITVRWQTLALGLTAQGFVVGAASQLPRDRLITAIMLALVILFIGVATIVTGERVEFAALADRHMLDVYESRLLRDGNEDLRLFHARPISERVAAMLGRSAFDERYSTTMRRVLQMLGMPGPHYWWSVCQMVISLAGAAIPILSQFSL
jgi:hypothetical protein